jgi:ATP-dependent DNA helicase DinG
MERFFLDKSCLAAHIPEYVPWDVQIEAARLIAVSFRDMKNIALEAPTGSGKTMSYLIPAFNDKGRTIIATKTKQLMSQLIKKDIPIVSKLFRERSVATLKGRKNYFCPQRFFKFIYSSPIFYADVVDWFEENFKAIRELPKGMFDEATLNKMSAHGYQCLRSKCEYLSDCPFITALKTANKADIVITNHHLVMAGMAGEAAEKEHKLFDTVEHIIFDEAHTIEDTFANYAGAEFSIGQILSVLNDAGELIDLNSHKKINRAAETIFKKVLGDERRQGKVLLGDVLDEIEAFFETARKISNDLNDENVTHEVNHCVGIYEEITAGDDGLKLVEQRGRDMLVRYIPADISGEFSKKLRQLAHSAVFISATLTADGSFDYYLDQLGLTNDSMITATMPSVFKMNKQAILFVPKKSYGYANDDLILQLVKEIDGSVLIICNSLERMKHLVLFFNGSQKKSVISQNDGDWSTFTSKEDTILIGCAMLREGIDLAGSNFRCVIIDKLPFENPSDLYIAYKSGLAEEKYGSGFRNYNLPRAVLYFKQAAGRLIRHERDKGLLAIFDDRILSKSYGRNFLNVLENIEVTNDLATALAFLA